MTPRPLWSRGPFTVVECDSGEQYRYDTLADATEFARTEANLGRVTATYDAHGQIVGSTELSADPLDGVA